MPLARGAGGTFDSMIKVTTGGSSRFTLVGPVNARLAAVEEGARTHRMRRGVA